MLKDTNSQTAIVTDLDLVNVNGIWQEKIRSVKKTINNSFKGITVNYMTELLDCYYYDWVTSFLLDNIQCDEAKLRKETDYFTGLTNQQVIRILIKGINKSGWFKLISYSELLPETLTIVDVTANAVDVYANFAKEIGFHKCH